MLKTSRSFGKLLLSQCKCFTTHAKPEMYTEQHVAMQQSLAKIIEKDIDPFIEEWEEARQFPAHKIFKMLGEAGFLGVTREKKYGGLELDFSYSAALCEQFGDIKTGAIPMAVGIQTDMATHALAHFGSEKLKQEFLAPSIAGDIVACLGVSEVQSGSDVAGITTTAKQVGDDFVINGGKMWTTNGHQADWMCLLANTEPDERSPHRNKSLICLPMHSPGVTRGRRIAKMGMWSSDTAQIFFEEVRVPVSHVIGARGSGFTQQMIQFQIERLTGCLGCLRPLQRMLDETAEYARQRRVFGRPLLDNQVVQFRLGEWSTELELLRALLHKAVHVYTFQGDDVTLLASMAKLKTGKLARELGDGCVQLWGGMGYTTENVVNRLARDLRLISIGAGSDETMLLIINKLMGLDTVRAKK